jgi:hypothetical protein
MSNQKRKPPSPEIAEPEVIIDKGITVQAARQAIAQERQQRALECSKEINTVLKKYNCELFAVPMINTEGRIVAQAQIASKE